MAGLIRQPGVVLDEDLFQRMRKQVLTAEHQPQTVPAPSKKNTGQRHLRRFRLLTEVRMGKPGVGRPQFWNEGLNQWEDNTESVRTEIIYHGPGRPQVFPKEAPVLCDYMPGTGYVIVVDCIVAYLGNPAEERITPFAVFSVQNDGRVRPGVINVAGGDDPRGDYVCLNGGITETELGRPAFNSDTRIFKIVPVTQVPPCWMSYDASPDSDIPIEVQEHFGWEATDNPNPGEYWAPRDYKLRRTVRLLPLYWYKWTPPPPVCAVNPDYDPDTNPDVPKGFWPGTDVECDPDADPPEDPPDDVLAEPVWWIAPVGWWGWGWAGWGFGNWGWNGVWNYPSWYHLGASVYNYWGAWGYGWWSSHWNGYPPDEDDIPDPDGPVPQPPVGEITRECLYGYVVWHWGWRVMATDEEQKVAFTWGPGVPFRYFNDLVVVNGSPDDCPPSGST